MTQVRLGIFFESEVFFTLNLGDIQILNWKTLGHLCQGDYSFKVTGTLYLNGLKVIWLERSRLGDGPPAIHYFLNFPFNIVLN